MNHVVLISMEQEEPVDERQIRDDEHHMRELRIVLREVRRGNDEKELFHRSMD